MLLSVSQIKTFIKDPNAWVGNSLYHTMKKLDRPDHFFIYFCVGSAVHKAIEIYNNTGDRDKWYSMWVDYMVDEIGKHEEWEVWPEDIITMQDQFDYAVSNYKRLQEKQWIWRHDNAEIYVEWNVFWHKFRAYLDAAPGDDTVVDYKVVSKLSKESDKGRDWGMNKYYEYRLQGWLYMKLTKRKKAIFIEILKEDTLVPETTTYKKDKLIELCWNIEEWDEKLTKKKLVEKYKPRREPWQVITYTFDEQLDDHMTSKYKPVIDEMEGLYDSFHARVDKEELIKKVAKTMESAGFDVEKIKKVLVELKA